MCHLRLGLPTRLEVRQAELARSLTTRCQAQRTNDHIDAVLNSLVIYLICSFWGRPFRGNCLVKQKTKKKIGDLSQVRDTGIQQGRGGNKIGDWQWLPDFIDCDACVLLRSANPTPLHMHKSSLPQICYIFSVSCPSPYLTS